MQSIFQLYSDYMQVDIIRLDYIKQLNLFILYFYWFLIETLKQEKLLSHVAQF